MTNRPGYKYFLLLLLLLVYAVNTMDRIALSVLLQDIKAEFALTDTGLGLLGGVAFAFFYSFMGIPLARWLDRGNKGKILAGCILLWSVATIMCGLATGFATLLLARVLTAVGEAGGSPASHALLSDYFTDKQLVTALALFALGVPLGSTIGNFSAGWLNQLHDWHVAFIVLGVPGLLVSVLVYFTVREPSPAAAIARAPKPQPSLREVAGFLWQQKAYVHMCLAAALHSLVYYSGVTWNASFLIRTHGLGTGQAGTLLASFSLAGLLSTFIGGYMANTLANKYHDPRWVMWVPGISMLLMFPFQLSSYLSSDYNIMLASFWVMMTLASTFFGPAYAVCQSLARHDMRAMASAVYLFTQTLIGLGLGPLLVGMISDGLAADLGAKSLGVALVIVGVVNLWSGWHYFIGSKSYRANIVVAQNASLAVPSQCPSLAQ